ncbi:MAG: SPFH domain-containing protein [Planctomycetota bacterium]|jgi:regulator of protease activity HflC (stomatin/prohibitin superfamily)
MDIIINKKLVSIPLLPIVAAVFLLILLLMGMRIGKVQADEVGVFVNNFTGDVEVTTQTGSTFYSGLWMDFYSIKKTEQTIRMEGDDAVRIKTKDGSDVSLDVFINYRLTSSSAVIASAVIPECGADKVIPRRTSRRVTPQRMDAYRVKWIREYSRSIIRHVFGEMDTDDFYDAAKRADKGRQATSEINAALKEEHGIETTLVVPDKFRFYTEYEEKIAAKKAADQEVQSQIEEAAAALKTQEKETVTATAEANVAIAQMEGTLRQELLAMEAEAAKARLNVEAYAYSIKTDADARFIKAQNDAQGRLAVAKAEAEGLRKIAESLAGGGGANLVKLELAKTLKGATISGVPYATDPRIQKVEIDTKNADLGGSRKGGK